MFAAEPSSNSPNSFFPFIHSAVLLLHEFLFLLHRLLICFCVLYINLIAEFSFVILKGPVFLVWLDPILVRFESSVFR